MLNLMKSEMYRMHKRVLIIFMLILIVSLFWFGYKEVQASHFFQMQLAKIETVIYNCKSEMSRIGSAAGEGVTENSEYELLSNYYEKLNVLKNYYSDPLANNKEIQELKNEINIYFYAREESGYEINENLLLVDKENLKEEIELFDTYRQYGLYPPSNPIKPTSIYILYDLLNGYNILWLIVLGVLTLLITSIWADDKDYKTYYLYICLPYKKRTLFLSRFILNIFISFFAFLILILSSYFISFIISGNGNNVLIHTAYGYREMTEVIIPLMVYKLIILFFYSSILQFVSVFIRKGIEYKIWTVSLLIVDYFIATLITNIFSIHIDITNTTKLQLSINCIIIFIIAFTFMKCAEKRFYYD